MAASARTTVLGQGPPWTSQLLTATSSSASAPATTRRSGGSSSAPQLPENQRRVFMLRDIDGYSSVEVCEMMLLSEVNQRVLLHRARSRVRAALEDELGVRA